MCKLKKLIKVGNKRIQKEKNKIRCLCGGEMEMVSSKKYSKEFNIPIICSAIFPPVFKCKKCKKVEGSYSVIGRNLFYVEPMSPPAGLVFYLDAKYGKYKK